MYDYDKNQHDYASNRKADPRIEQLVWERLGDSQSVINVGAGTGSYEPPDKYVVAVEPSSVMRGMRTLLGRNPAVNAVAQNLPFDDGSFDASLAILTIHHWPDLRAGLAEMRRVTRKTMILLTYDPAGLDSFWNAEYFPEVVEAERGRYPTITSLTSLFDAVTTVIPIPIPLDCTDGFQEAFYGRPEAFLREEVRRAQSAWGFVDQPTERRLISNFAEALRNGSWDKAYGHYRTAPTFTGAFRLVEFRF